MSFPNSTSAGLLCCEDITPDPLCFCCYHTNSSSNGTTTNQPTSSTIPTLSPTLSPSASPTHIKPSFLADSSTAYLLSLVVATPLLLFVLITYCRFKRIRAHPAPLMFARTVADTGFIFSFLILAWVSDAEERLSASELERICSEFGTFTILFFNASQLYFIGMCYDLYVTLSYPLRSTAYTEKQIHVYVWGLALLFSLIGLSVDNDSFDYLEDSELCFFGTKEDSFQAYEQWVVIIGPYIVGVLSGISSLVFVFFRLRNGLTDIFLHATRMVHDHVVFVALYTCLGVVWLFLLLLSNQLTLILTLIMIGTAVIDAGTWYIWKFKRKGTASSSSSRKTGSKRNGNDLQRDINHQGGRRAGTETDTYTEPNPNPNHSGVVDGDGGGRQSASASASSGWRHRYHRETSLGQILRKRTDAMTTEPRLEDMVISSMVNKQLKRESEENISAALRMELIRSMCNGVTQAIDHFRHNTEFTPRPSVTAKQSASSDHNQHPHSGAPHVHKSQSMDYVADITAAHFPPVAAVKLKPNSESEKECIENQSIHKFLMFSKTTAISVNLSSKNANSTPFIEYAPHVFKYLRVKVYKISENAYFTSLKQTIDKNLIADVSAKFSEGKSGAFFFMTSDNRFMVKTVSKSEATVLLKILPGYFEHMRKLQASLIAKFLGLFSMKIYGTKIYFIIMLNLFVPFFDPHEKYDIKGSWINRHTKHHIEMGKLMKDSDFHKSILVEYTKSKRIWEQLSHDTRFLCALNIMDYSLLLGIYHIGIESKSEQFRNQEWTMNRKASNTIAYQPPTLRQNQQHDQEQQLHTKGRERVREHQRAAQRVKKHTIDENVEYSTADERAENGGGRGGRGDEDDVKQVQMTPYQLPGGGASILSGVGGMGNGDGSSSLPDVDGISHDLKYNTAAANMNASSSASSAVWRTTNQQQQRYQATKSMSSMNASGNPSSYTNSTTVFTIDQHQQSPALSSATFPRVISDTQSALSSTVDGSSAGNRSVSHQGVYHSNQHGHQQQNQHNGHQHNTQTAAEHELKHSKSGSHILSVNTYEMEKEQMFEVDANTQHRPHRFQRRRAFTENSGLSEVSRHTHTYLSKTIEGPGFYTCGIIDILQDYDFWKKLERFFKVYIKCVDGLGISCIEPVMYRKRFLAKMLQIGFGRPRLD